MFLNFKIVKRIRFDMIFWGVCLGIPSVLGITVISSGNSIPLSDFLQLFLISLNIGMIVIIFLVFPYLLWSNNVIAEWLQFKLKTPEWKKLFITLLLVSSSIDILLVIKLWLYLEANDSKNVMALIREYSLLFLLSAEAVICIFILYVGAKLDAPPILTSQLKEISHELISKYPTEAIRKAFVIFEVTLREKIAAPIDTVGEKLINDAFKEDGGKLLYSTASAEQKGVRNLVAGFYAIHRNPLMHHDIEYDKARAELILLQLDHFMEIVDNCEINQP